MKKAEENCIRYGKNRGFYIRGVEEACIEEEEEIIKRAWKFGGISAIAFGFMPWW